MKRIIFPLDVSDLNKAEYFIDTLKEDIDILKLALNYSIKLVQPGLKIL